MPVLGKGGRNIPVATAMELVDDGHTKQCANLNQMIWSVAEQISELRLRRPSASLAKSGA